MVNTDLQSEIPGLYVCDASVFPEALGRPTVLTIIGLAKRLAKHLLGRDSESVTGAGFTDVRAGA